MKSFTSIAFFIGMVCASAQNELPMGPCNTPCLENCNLDWICTDDDGGSVPQCTELNIDVFVQGNTFNLCLSRTQAGQYELPPASLELVYQGSNYNLIQADVIIGSFENSGILDSGEDILTLQTLSFESITTNTDIEEFDLDIVGCGC